MSGDDRAAVLAAAMLGFRRARAEVLPGEIFAEPAWDLLLELFVADADGRPLTGREAAGRAGVPNSVMSRWLTHLHCIGLVVGDDAGDIDDPLTLSAVALERMEVAMSRAEAFIAAARA